MTKLIDSCKVMYGRDNFLKFFYVGMFNVAVMLAGVIIRGFVESESFLNGFINGFCTSFCGVVNIFISETVILGVFGAVRKVHPGYKYFHSIADGFSHFKNSLILANLAGILLTALYSAIGAFFFKNMTEYMIFTSLIVTGWCDLWGGSKYKWLSVVLFVPLGFVFGFAFGVLDKLVSISLVKVSLGVGVVFYILCFIFALKRAKKLWAREG